MYTKNNINSLLLERGFRQVVPTDQILENLGMTIKRFNKIISGKTELTLTEAAGFATWLGVTIDDLTNAPTVRTHDLADKLGLDKN